MNSRQRVLSALDRRQPDRVPIDCGGTRQSGIAASTYHKLKERLGLDTPTRVYDVYQMLAEIERPVMERFGADVIGLQRPAVAFGIRNEGWKPWRLFGTPDQVAQEVRQSIRILGAGGGYVLASVHNIQANVPPENVIAMFDAALAKC